MIKSKSNVLETVDNLCNPSIRAQGDQQEQNCQFFDENDFNRQQLTQLNTEREKDNMI